MNMRHGLIMGLLRDNRTSSVLVSLGLILHFLKNSYLKLLATDKWLTIVSILKEDIKKEVSSPLLILNLILVKSFLKFLESWSKDQTLRLTKGLIISKSIIIVQLIVYTLRLIRFWLFARSVSDFFNKKLKKFKRGK